MSIRKLMAAAAGGMVIVLGAGSISALQAQATPNDVKADSQFIRDVASTNLLEIQLGKLAQQKATNSAVKEFGNQMVLDHTKLELQWANTISKNGMPFQPGLNAQHQQEVTRLQAVSGPEFDRTYMTSMIQGHQTAVSSLQSGAQTAHSSVVRDLVTSALPTVQQHLTMAQQVGAQVGVTTVATTTPTGQAPAPRGKVPTPQVPTPQVPTPNGPTVNPNDQASADVRADSGFIREAVAGNFLEARLGRLAEGRATNTAVKQFAQRMVTDHSRLQDQWTGMASGFGMTFTPSLDQQHQQEVDRLQNLSGNDFDRAYMSTMVQLHQTDVDRFENEGRSARSAPVRSLVTTSLPVMQQHLTLASQVAGQVGADTAAIAAGNQGNQGRQGNVKTDEAVIRDIINAHYVEVRLGELAEKRSKDAGVKRLAQRLVTDHTRLENQWMSMGTRNGLALRLGLGSQRRQKVERLQQLSGKQFDVGYVTTVVENHQNLVRYLQKEGRAVHSAPARNLVKEDLPTVQQDLTLAMQVGREVGADIDVSAKNGGKVQDKGKE